VVVFFDNIDHDYLLNAIGKFPARELIRQWLKAGYMERGVFHDTSSGTPQGGVISPLLANIALHGMETAVGVKYISRGDNVGKRCLIRYADDFVVFCDTEDDARKAQSELSDWLAIRGLVLSTEKTRIAHLSDGFDFLGFNIRQYRAPGTRYGWKLLIKPSRKSVESLKTRLTREWRALGGQNITVVLARLNPVIRGWSNYYRGVVSKRLFCRLDNWIFTTRRFDGLGEHIQISRGTGFNANTGVHFIPQGWTAGCSAMLPEPVATSSSLRGLRSFGTSS
jgi:RNA-directed DNA polymerase